MSAATRPPGINETGLASQLTPPSPLPTLTQTVNDILASCELIEAEYRGYSRGLVDGARLAVAEAEDRGFRRGEEAAGARITAAITGCVGVWGAKTQAELAKLRNDPPATRGCNRACGWCAACTRHKHWLMMMDAVKEAKPRRAEALAAAVSR